MMIRPCNSIAFLLLTLGLGVGCKMSVVVPKAPFKYKPVTHSVPAENPAPSDVPSVSSRRATGAVPSNSVPGSDVRPVSLQQAFAPDPKVEPLSTEDMPPLEEVFAAGPLQLDEVIFSVQESYPLLLTALLEAQVADGKRISTLGEFDLGIKAFGIAAPEGFYQTYRQGLAFEQPLFGGGYVYGGYKNGDGNFQPWFKERETNEGGEFSAGVGVPLLKDREIDKRREALFVATLRQQAVQPNIQAQLLEFVRAASQSYWKWVAAGQAVVAQRELLELAKARVEIIEARVEAEDLARIARINNDQLIAARETKVIEARRKLQEAAIKLSLFLRDEEGRPIVPREEALPTAFPRIQVTSPEQLEGDIEQALSARPELRELDLLARQVRVELSQANNMLLPKLDAQVLASKDVGAPTSSSGDKTPFELEFGLYGELPYQRREARGKIVSAQGKLAQIQAKRDFVSNKVTAQVQDAYSALQAAAERIDRANLNLRLALETRSLGQDQFNAGDIDLIDLNIYEQAATDAEILLISANLDFFLALADYRAALAISPTAQLTPVAPEE